MNSQKIFYKVCNNLIAQRKPCRSKHSAWCIYRYSKNVKCAVGWLIPDDKYKNTTENLNISQLVQSISYMKNMNKDLLRDMQIVHDSAPWSNLQDPQVFIDHIKVGMKKVAVKHNLTTPF